MTEKGYLSSIYSSFTISDDFINQSAMAKSWYTAGSSLSFVGDSSKGHDFCITGADFGPFGWFYKENFAWGRLILSEFDQDGNIKPGTQQTVHLHDGNTTPGGALYVGEIRGLAFDENKKKVTNIIGSGLDNILNIY